MNELYIVYIAFSLLSVQIASQHRRWVWTAIRTRLDIVDKFNIPKACKVEWNEQQMTRRKRKKMTLFINSEIRTAGMYNNVSSARNEVKAEGLKKSLGPKVFSLLNIYQTAQLS